jgi:hypothetical protein
VHFQLLRLAGRRLPLSAAPRAPAALSATSGRSPRALCGFSVQALASSGARSAMSPSGETPPGRRQVGMNKRLRVYIRHPAPLPAKNQGAIYSVCFPQGSQVNKVLLLCRSMLVLRSCCLSHMLIELLLHLAASLLRSDTDRREVRFGGGGVDGMPIAHKGCEWIEEVVVRWYFWIFEWGCGYKGRWASRRSEGEGVGALGSSHSGRALGRSSTSA